MGMEVVSATSSEDSVVSPTRLLDKVSYPADLRKLPVEDLIELCEELRTELVSSVSQIGGHFASALGVVELTVALHKVFNTPNDRLIWDVGHQGYIHKILTGRRAELKNVRQYNGISGFLRREESEYDAFGAGHAGTSISAATGMLEASYHGADSSNDEKRNVVAVIGDGSLTAGMAFEALNHAGQLHRKLIVVLNDNEMSIAPNVGALSLFLSKAVTGKVSTNARRHFKSLVEKGLIPHALYRAIDRAEEATQGFLSTPAMIFGAFGFRYIGPVDGHHLPSMIDALERAKDQDGPVIVHALTVKGKGYEPAEIDPVKYHGVTPFSVVSGAFKKTTSPKSYSSVFGEALVELCKLDERVVGITAAMPDGTGLKILQKEMPDRYFDVGIAEQHGVTFAAGLACEGLRPVVAIYSTFLQRAFDQVVHDVCIQNLPVIFALDRGGLAGADGPTHHGVFDLAYLRSIPNLTLMAPRNGAQLRQMLYSALKYEAGPVAFRFPRGDAEVFEKGPLEVIPRGKSEIMVEAADSKNLIIAIGPCVQFAVDAANKLTAEEKPTSVLDARFIKPLDEELIAKLVKQNSVILTVEDHQKSGGLGTAVVELLADKDLLQGKKVIRLGIDDEFIPHGSQPELYKLCGFDAEAIYSALK
jgi:1-deoxy-D-xylulose-5-phosphate synthase